MRRLCPFILSSEHPNVWEPSCSWCAEHTDPIEHAIDRPFEEWSHDCHGVSIAIVQARLFPEARVARGWCRGVRGQHSWVVLGDDCYDKDATIIDPTLWSYTDDVKGIWVGTLADGWHHPHGEGHIFEAGRPPSAEEAGEDVYETEVFEDLSPAAKSFLDIIGPLGLTGWRVLLHLPVGGWPAAEIVDAAYDDENLRVILPIDIVGMLTDRNPSGVYLADKIVT